MVAEVICFPHHGLLPGFWFCFNFCRGCQEPPGGARLPLPPALTWSCCRRRFGPQVVPGFWPACPAPYGNTRLLETKVFVFASVDLTWAASHTAQTCANKLGLSLSRGANDTKNGQGLSGSCHFFLCVCLCLHSTCLLSSRLQPAFQTPFRLHPGVASPPPRRGTSS